MGLRNLWNKLSTRVMKQLKLIEAMVIGSRQTISRLTPEL